MNAPVVKLHAVQSPSGSPRWTICHASVQRIAALQRRCTSSLAADRGTIIHDLGEHGLLKGEDYIEERRGTRARVTEDGYVIYAPASSAFNPDGIVVEDDMCDAAHDYVAFVKMMSFGGELHVEERLSIEHITGELDATGTSDTIICFDDELCVVDLKGGFIRVMAGYPITSFLAGYVPQEVLAASLSALPGSPPIKMPNTQLAMYADAAREKYEMFYAFKRVRLIIFQPMLGHIDEIVFELDEFNAWIDWIREQARACDRPDARVVPSEETCRWCDVFPCAEADVLALSTAIDDLSTEDDPREAVVSSDAITLGRQKRLVPFVRMWANAVDAKVHAELAAGRFVSGWKMVKGSFGARKWTDNAQVSKQFESFGLKPDQYLVAKLVSPAAADEMVVRSERSERSAHRPLNGEQWKVLQSFITRDEGAPKVVPESDPRPALVIDPSADFDIINGE